MQALVGNGVNIKKIQLLGTGLWGTIRASPRRRRSTAAGTPRRTPPATAISPPAIAARFKQQPVRTATLAYDAVALVAALVKTQGPARFSPEVLTNPSGFTGIDGLFRFRADGTNERGLAVLQGHAVRRAGRSRRRRRASATAWRG